MVGLLTTQTQYLGDNRRQCAARGEYTDCLACTLLAHHISQPLARVTRKLSPALDTRVFAGRRHPIVKNSINHLLVVLARTETFFNQRRHLGIVLHHFGYQAGELFFILDFVEAWIDMMRYGSRLAGNRQAGSLTLARQIAAVYGVKVDAVVTKVLPHYRGLTTPQI